MLNSFQVNSKVSNIERLINSQEQFKNLLLEFDDPEKQNELLKKIHGEVQTNEHIDRKEVVVACRVRPLLPSEVDIGLFSTIQCLSSRTPMSHETVPNALCYHEPFFKVYGPLKLRQHCFKFDYVFPTNSENSEIYPLLLRPLVDHAIWGGWATMFSYGQTGTGKTFTMEGMYKQLAKDLNRIKFFDECLSEVQINGNESKFKKELQLGIFEILGDKVYDLMNGKNEVAILEDKLGEVKVSGLKEILIKSEEELQKKIQEACSYRRTSATQKNDNSSRSHCVVRLKIRNNEISQTQDGVLHLIDLAGSERHADTAKHSALRLKETKAINTSLLNLKQCIRHRMLAVADIEGLHISSDSFGGERMDTKNHYHIPYRSSKLTLLIKEMLDVNSSRACKTVALATISPTVADISHSLNTLRYISPLHIAFLPMTDIDLVNRFDPINPRTWNNDELKVWVDKNSNHKISPEILCPEENGYQLCQIPENEFISRCLKCDGVTKKQARIFYLKLWGLLIDVRTKKFKEQLKEAKKRAQQQSMKKDKARYDQMMEQQECREALCLIEKMEKVSC